MARVTMAPASRLLVVVQLSSARRLSAKRLTLLLTSMPACKRWRKPQTLEAIDQIDRRENVPMTQPAVARDLAQIRERGTLVVLAPYNSTTYFVYRGEPFGYDVQAELRGSPVWPVCRDRLDQIVEPDATRVARAARDDRHQLPDAERR